MSTATLRPRFTLTAALLLLAGIAGSAALWVMVAVVLGKSHSLLAFLVALDIWLMLLLARLRPGLFRAGLAALSTLSAIALAQFWHSAVWVGLQLAIMPWDAIAQMRPEFAWTLLQLGTGVFDWLAYAAAIALAAWLAR